MWITIGVGILMVAQAGAVPSTGRVQPTTTATAQATGVGEVDLPTSDASAPSVMSDTTLRFRNDVGDAFEMTEARFTLDGRDLPTLLTSAARGQEYVVFTGQIAPGRHSLTSHVVYQARSRSIFTYMKGYTFTLDTTHELNVPNTGATSATIIGRPNKGLTVAFEHSLKVDMEQQQPTALSGAR
jgi:hypothetical protein